MKKLSIVRCALLSFIAVTSLVYSNEDQDAAEYVIRHAYTSIARIEKGKIFLKPEKLHLNQGVIYVEDVNGGGFAIPVSFSSVGRPYMQVDESILFNSWQCSCGI